MYSTPSSKLFVGCLPFSKTEADLTTLFVRFGKLTEVAMLKKGDGSSKGAAFVTFADAQCAANAMMHLQGYVFDGSNRGINVSAAGVNMGGKGGGGGGMGSLWSNRKGGVPKPSSNFKGLPSMGHSQQPQMSSSMDIPGTKCFVGKLPFSRSENDLMQLFSSCGPVVEVAILKDKLTKEKTGAALVRFGTPQHAAAAVSALNGFMFHGSTRPISVEIAQEKIGSIGSKLGTFAGKRPSSGLGNHAIAGPDCKLFVGQLPFSKSELAIQELFQQYGSVIEVALLRKGGQKTGGAFVSFSDPDSAAAALELNGYTFPGATRPCTVSPATKRQRTGP